MIIQIIFNCSIFVPLPNKDSVIFSSFISVEFLLISISVLLDLFGFNIFDKDVPISQRDRLFNNTNEKEQNNEKNILNLYGLAKLKILMK